MSPTAREILDSFEKLPDREQREVAVVILHRVIDVAYPPLQDDELVALADQLFVALDSEEEAAEQSSKG
jgi:hypothetical protein